MLALVLQAASVSPVRMRTVGQMLAVWLISLYDNEGQSLLGTRKSLRSMINTILIRVSILKSFAMILYDADLAPA